MAKILFWNVFRLGTTSLKVDEISDILEEIHLNQGQFQNHNLGPITYIAFCEITSNFYLEFTDPTQPNAYYYYFIPTYKQVVVPKKTSKKTNQQLGYALLETNSNLRLDLSTNSDLSPEIVNNFSTIFGATMNNLIHETGSNFDQCSKRKLAMFGDRVANKYIYVYHSNASGRSAITVPWMIGYLLRKHRHNNNQEFVLMGDFNCNPNNLNKKLLYQLHQNYQTNFYLNNNVLQGFDTINNQQVALLNNGYITRLDIKDNGATHGVNTYDYVIYCSNNNIDIVSPNLLQNPSDHKLIIIDL